MKQGTWGKIQIYTGDGKGKTTAALGTALRAYSQNKKVVFVYFDKGGSHYSEENLLKKLGIEYYRFGLDRIDPDTNEFRFGVLKKDIEQGTKALEKTRELLQNADLDVLVLDEINVSASLGIIDVKNVLDILKDKPVHLELIMTGRHAPTEFIDLADLVTEMSIVKHYFYSDELARFGLDY